MPGAAWHLSTVMDVSLTVHTHYALSAVTCPSFDQEAIARFCRVARRMVENKSVDLKANE